VHRALADLGPWAGHALDVGDAAPEELLPLFAAARADGRFVLPAV